jgi:putative hydrolase of the HAD superfamily
MLTTLIVPRGTREVFHEDWELEGRDDNHLLYVTDHLADFLEKVHAAMG